MPSANVLNFSAAPRTTLAVFSLNPWLSVSVSERLQPTARKTANPNIQQRIRPRSQLQLNIFI
jgi:hypothetical protein